MTIKRSTIAITSLTAWFYSTSTIPILASTMIPQELVDAIDLLWEKYWFYIAIFVSLGVLTGVLAFIVLFIRLGKNATNPQERSRIFNEMLAVGITTAALGGITFVVTLVLALFN